MKKKIIAITISTLLIFMFLAGCGTKTETKTKGGLKIHSWDSGLGSVNNVDLNETKFSYTVNLTNENENDIYIQSMQPSINEKLKNKIISKNTAISVNKVIKPDETIKISGEIIFDTKGLSKSDISRLEPFITDIKVSTEQTINLQQ